MLGLLHYSKCPTSWKPNRAHLNIIWTNWTDSKWNDHTVHAFVNCNWPNRVSCVTNEVMSSNTEFQFIQINNRYSFLAIILMVFGSLLFLFVWCLLFWGIISSPVFFMTFMLYWAFANTIHHLKRRKNKGGEKLEVFQWHTRQWWGKKSKIWPLRTYWWIRKHHPWEQVKK